MSDSLSTIAHVPPSLSTERRKSPRYALCGRAEVLTAEPSGFQADVRNISLTGCYLATRHTMALHSRLILHLDFGGTSMQLNGTVCRTDMSGMGVQFDPESTPDGNKALV